MLIKPRRHRRQTLRCAIAGLGAVAALTPSDALAANRYYVGPSGGNWTTGANWSTVEGGGGSTGAPANADHVFVRGSLTRTVNFDEIHSPFVRIGTLQVDSSGGGAVSTVSQTLSTTQMRATHEHIGFASGGSGAYVYTGGNHNVSGSIYLGHGQGSSGQYTIGGTANLTVGGYTYVGYSGSGTFTHDGGTHAVAGSLKLGEWASGSGTYNLSAGRVSSAETYIGSAGSGTFEQTGGTHSISGSLSMAGGIGTTARYNLGGGELTVGGANSYFGSYGNAVFVQSGGTHTLGGNVYFGSSAGGHGSYTLADGADFFVAGQERIGYGGNGTFIQSGGTHTTTGTTHIGSLAGSNGLYQLSGGLRTVRGAYSVGAAGAGTMEQSGGTHIVESEMFLGQSSGSSGRYELSGTGVLDARTWEYVGYNGPATFNQSGGRHTVAQLLYLGVNAAGTYTLAGGELAPRRLWVKNQGALAMSGGAVNITDGIDLDGAADFAGGASTLNATTRGIIDLGRGALTNTAGLTINGSPQTLAIFPAGFDPATQLAGYANPGLTGYAGSTIVIPAGRSIIGDAELTDPVHVAGSLERTISLALRSGITVAGGGSATVSELSMDGATSTVSDTANLNVSNFAAVGEKASGAFVQSGGTHAVTTLSLGSQSVPSLGVRGRGRYELSAGTLTAGSEYVGNAGDGTFLQTGGTHTVSGTLSIAHLPGSTGTFTLAGGTLSVGTLINRGTFNYGGGTLTATNLQLLNGGEMAIAAGAGTTLDVASVSTDSASALDLSDNKLVVRGGDIGAASGGTYSGVTGQIAAAHHGGAWDGNGITTSMPDAATGLTTLAIATAGQVGVTTFGGLSVSGDDVIVMYTYGGDSNLDGKIDADDYGSIDFNILVSGASGYANGDFNYDGVINADDYGSIDFNILAQGAPFPTGAAADAVVAVPEPGVAGLMLLAPLAGLVRRRRCARAALACETL